MPASEETRVDIKLLHLLFGIAAIVMFFCTVWLLVVDHRREWKDYQRKFQAIQNWTLVSRDNEQQTEKYNRKRIAIDPKTGKPTGHVFGGL